MPKDGQFSWHIYFVKMHRVFSRMINSKKETQSSKQCKTISSIHLVEKATVIIISPDTISAHTKSSAIFRPAISWPTTVEYIRFLSERRISCHKIYLAVLLIKVFVWSFRSSGICILDWSRTLFFTIFKHFSHMPNFGVCETCYHMLIIFSLGAPITKQVLVSSSDCSELPKSH